MSTPGTRSDLGPRLVTAAVGIPLLLALAFMAPNWGLAALLVVAAMIGAWEYVAMMLRPSVGVDGALAPVAVGAALSGFYVTGALEVPFAAITVLVVLTLVLAMRRAADIGPLGARVGHTLGAAAYTATLFGSYLALIRTGSPMEIGPHQAGWLLFPMCVIFAGDTGAYFAGRAFGKHKLAPIVSPKKTWEGAVGGMVASVVGGFIAWRFLPLPDGLSPVHVLLFSVPAAVLGQVGDLAESLLKRSAGVKDSGWILYGHGGVLDRVDALLFAAPWFLVVRTWSGL